jgi:diguanylate cyclase (GGDEF)-like protein
VTDHLVATSPDGSNDRLLIKQAASLLATDLSLGELFERLTTLLPAHLDSAVVFIALARPDGKHAIEYIYDHGEIRRYPHIELSERSRARAVIASGEPIWGNTPETWAPQGAVPINSDRPWTNDTLSAMFVPMRAAGATVGCLSVQSVHRNAYTEDDVETIGAIGHYLGVAVENQRMYRALARSADFDALTSLANHSRMVREIDAALGSATQAQPIAAVMLDIVGFARFNETYGYRSGDEVLRRIAVALRAFEDADDSIVAGRLGGDAFMVLLRDHGADLAEHTVERLCAKLSEIAHVAQDQTIPIPIACGYALAPLDVGGRAELIALCDQRTRTSRAAGAGPIGPQGDDGYTLYGDFSGVETIVESLLERDPFTRVHLLHVNAMAHRWSERGLELDASERDLFLRASLLHDAGKLLISDRVLSKPGRLNGKEFAAVMQHAEFGRHILARHCGYETVARIVGEHHERWDGGGYPAGLRGTQIHPLARAIAVLDAFSAMVADRPYHRAITEDGALAELQRCAGTQFDPELVARFVAWREEGNPPRR